MSIQVTLPRAVCSRCDRHPTAFWSRATLLVFALVLFGCSPIQVQVEHDPEASFQGLKTFAWSPLPEPTKDEDLVLRGYVRDAVEGELGKRGFVVASPVTSDFLLTYHAEVEKKTEVTGIPREGRYDGSTRDPVEDTYVRVYEEGKLLLDVVVPETQKVVWRGEARAIIFAGASEGKRKARIHEAVRRLIEQFPPE